MQKNLSIRGRSLGGIYTSVYIPELSIMFDAGVALRSHIAAKVICLSHGHVDHVGALPAFLGMRGLFGQRDPITVYCPKEIVDDLRDGLRSFEKIQGYDFNVRLQGLSPGDEISLSKRLRLRAFRTYHPAPSLGYLVYETVQKLKPEFHGLPGRELRQRRVAGEPIFNETERHYFAYVTDTLPQVLKREPWLKSVEDLMLECTFLDERKPVKLARKGGHIHLDDLAPFLDEFENQRLHLMHFSQLYTPGQIRSILSSRCSPKVRPEVIPLLPDSDLEWWH